MPSEYTRPVASMLYLSEKNPSAFPRSCSNEPTTELCEVIQIIVVLLVCVLITGVEALLMLNFDINVLLLSVHCLLISSAAL